MKTYATKVESWKSPIRLPWPEMSAEQAGATEEETTVHAVVATVGDREPEERYVAAYYDE